MCADESIALNLILNFSHVPSEITLRCVVQDEFLTEELSYAQLVKQLLHADAEDLLAGQENRLWICGIYSNHDRLNISNRNLDLVQSWLTHQRRSQNFEALLPQLKEYFLEFKDRPLQVETKLFYVDTRIIEIKIIKAEPYQSIEMNEYAYGESSADGFNASAIFHQKQAGLQVAFGFHLKKIDKSNIVQKSHISTGQGFIHLMNWFSADILKASVTTILAHWYVPYQDSLSDNYLSYMRAKNEGLSKFEAAKSTWSGQAYEKMGFLPDDVDEENSGFVKVVFVKK